MPMPKVSAPPRSRTVNLVIKSHRLSPSCIKTYRTYTDLEDSLCNVSGQIYPNTSRQVHGNPPTGLRQRSART